MLILFMLFFFPSLFFFFCHLFVCLSQNFFIMPNINVRLITLLEKRFLFRFSFFRPENLPQLTYNFVCVGTLWNNYIKKPHNQRTKKIQRIKLNRNECTAKYTTLVIINVASMMRTRMLLCVFFAFLFFPLFPCGAIILCWFPFYFSLSCVYRDRLVCWIAVQLYLIPVCFVQLDFECVRIFTFYLPFSSSKTFSRFCSILQFTWCYYVISTYHFFQSECHVFFFFHKNQMKQQQQ